MKKQIITISICLIIFLTSFSGCIEDSSKDKKEKMVYVNANGRAEFSKIQDAIDHVIEGSSIFVYNGFYNESLEINKSINLIGENKDNTIIHYHKTYSNEPDSVIKIKSDNCKINGFKITSVNYSIPIHMIGIKIYSSYNTITNNIIKYADKCINIKQQSKNNDISFNTISHARDGIYIESSSNNNIKDNNISSFTIHGIYISDSDQNIITGNYVSYNYRGIRIAGKNSKNNKVFRNTIINNTDGVYCCCSANNNEIYYNNFIKNSERSAYDEIVNQWYNGNIGNYWDDYLEKNPDAIQIDGIWNTPYNIPGKNSMDIFPLVNPVDI